MTKEELEKEAEEWLSKNWTPYDFYDTECNVYNDDIKDDLIEAYLAGTEPREKRITDLEKENAELRNNGFTVSAMTEQQLKVALEKGEQLEKENAELKKKNLDTQDAVTMQMYTNKANKEIADKQLTNAKEIISEYINILKGDTKNWKKTQEKAEQFLNSEVEK